ncbi:hypothetical protein [Xanthomonas arboricola]|uniref:hypothetical protein n=2 Tax=Xanthomonas TaxID=338 RepID=UPI0012907C2C|nr:hypothetical protein [Xanthomonas arboricola]
MSEGGSVNELKKSYRLNSGEILEVSPGAIDAVRAALGTEDYKKVSVEFFQKITGLRESYEKTKNYYIVKSKKDDVEGVYSGFFNQGRLTLNYSHLGECGQLVPDMVVVLVDAELTSVSSGCSGAL